MIADFHSHILPGIDDGSSCLEMSISMLKMEAAQGIRQVVATPHFYPLHDNPDKFLSRREEAERILREEMSRIGGLPELYIGAEIHYFRGISESDVLRQLTINRKRCILLEMPMDTWTDGMFQELEDIYTRQRLTPILAHIERYLPPIFPQRFLARLAELPVLIQSNASFIARRQKMALRMLRNEQIHLLGSDCHNLISRCPNLDGAIARIQKQLGQSVLERIVQTQNSVLGLDD